MPKLNFLVRGIVCYLFVFLPLASMDQWFYDHFFRLRGAVQKPTKFVLVRINDSKLYPELPQGNPFLTEEDFAFKSRPLVIWNTKFYNALLSRIEADEPALIVFTSYYEWVDKLARPTLQFPNLLFSAMVNEENKLIPPSPKLTSGENYGYANIFPDPDNVVRKHRLVYSSGSSLALRTYNRLNQAPIKRNLLEPIWIDFRGPAGSYPNVDAAEVLEEGFPEGRFKGKIVLIGREESPASFYETPFGRMAREEVIANTIDTFISGRDIQILPRWVMLAVAAAAVTVSIAIILAFPLTLAWLFLLLLSLVFLLVALFVFSQFKVWAGIANPVFCIFGTHLLMIGYKLSRQEEQQWKIQQESEYLREMDKFKNNFISLFSHDLKTPIAKIKAIADRVLTEDRSLSSETRESLKGIDRASGELARLISDILKVTKMESMSLEPAKEVIDLNRMVEIAVGRLKFLADEKNIELVLDLEPLFSMEGDQQLIQEVITNLIENAIKYSGSEKTVIVRTTEHEGYVRVSVIDQGMGIPADELPRVTSKFYRGRAVTDKTKGTGLGLYLAKYFVELHQGSLEIKSEVGRGTEVSFHLPLPA